MQPNMTVPVWVTNALDHINIHEVQGAESHPVIKSFYRDVGHAHIEHDEIPWCAAFVGSVLERSKIPSTKSLLARSYLKWGHALKTLQFGAIAVFKRGNNRQQGHVGFVMGFDRASIFLLGGNQSNQVNVKAYKRSDLLDVRWPAEPIDNPVLKQDPIFEFALGEVLKLEGGWAHHRDDPGGATNKGITLKTYERAIQTGLIRHPNKKLIDGLKIIKDDEVRAIYHTLYWIKAGCFELPPALALMHFDAAVNHGVKRAVQFIQKLSGAIVDGEWGPQTLHSVSAINIKTALGLYERIRRHYYQTRPHFSIFGKGWMNRLASVYASSLVMHDKNVDQSNHKEEDIMTQPQATPSQKWWGESLTVWGTIVTALSTILPVIGPFFGLDITSEMIEQFGDSVTKLIQIIGGVTGTIMALYGRARAETSLTRRPISMKI